MRPVIVEGPDGAGKSTLAFRIGSHFRWEVIHDGGPIRSRQQFLARVVEKEYNIKRLVVYDRCCYISELVYGSLNRGKAYTTQEELAAFLKDLNPLIIFCCLDSSDEMVDRMLMVKPHATPEFKERIKLDHPIIVQKYQQLFRSIPVYAFNWKEDKLDKLIKHVEMTCVD